jgi:hypothetical protein
MTTTSRTLTVSRTLAVSLLSGVFLLSLQAANAQTNPPSATATRPAKSPDETSIPNAHPQPTQGQTTGEAPRDPTVKKMNEDEKQKVETKGK